MPKIRKKAWESPTSENPVDEMRWCFERGIRVCVMPEVNKEGRYFIQTGRYALEIKQGDKVNCSEYIYTAKNINDAINDAYRKIYQMNNGKK